MGLERERERFSGKWDIWEEEREIMEHGEEDEKFKPVFGEVNTWEEREINLRLLSPLFSKR